MNDRSGQKFFERAVTIHRYDCSAIDAGAETPDTRPGADDMTALLADDRSVRYGVAARSAYDGLRRLIGQLAGLAILLTASRRRDILDLPDISIAREHWRDTGTALAALDTPTAFGRHFASLTSAHSLVGEILDALEALRASRDTERVLDRANVFLKEAYRVLQDASEPRTGMTMVDFNHACCSCAATTTALGGAR